MQSLGETMNVDKNAQKINGAKSYPKVITLKKGIVGIVGLLLLVIVGTVFYNIRHSTQQQSIKATQNVDKKVTGSTVNTSWYRNQVVQKKPAQASVKPIVPAPSVNSGDTVVAQNSQVVQTSSQTGDDYKKILSAPITSNQINDTSVSSNANVKVTPVGTQTSDNTQEQQKNDDQNMQGEKRTFLKLNSLKEEDYLQEGLKNPFSPYELKAGTVIPAILITGINSDLPGQITAQIRQNVYDTISGRYVLVPQGAKLVGLYDSQIAYGQSRILVVWKRIIYPNGQSINLEGMPGVDISGYAGFGDKVNNHYMKIFGSVILMSAISAGAQLSQTNNNNNNNNNTPTVNQELAASLGVNIMNAANMMLQKNLGLQPTIVIRPGYLMNVSVTKDIVFPGAYNEGTSYVEN